LDQGTETCGPLREGQLVKEILRKRISLGALLVAAIGEDSL